MGNEDELKMQRDQLFKRCEDWAMRGNVTMAQALLERANRLYPVTPDQISRLTNCLPQLRTGLILKTKMTYQSA